MISTSLSRYVGVSQNHGSLLGAQPGLYCIEGIHADLNFEKQALTGML